MGLRPSVFSAWLAQQSEPPPETRTLYGIQYLRPSRDLTTACRSGSVLSRVQETTVCHHLVRRPNDPSAQSKSLAPGSGVLWKVSSSANVQSEKMCLTNSEDCDDNSLTQHCSDGCCPCTKGSTNCSCSGSSRSSQFVKDSPCREWIEFLQYPFENIVLSGGGSKGYCYIGAIKALDDCGLLSKVKRVAGSSAGAICAALVAARCSSQEIADLFAGDNKWLFHDQNCAYCFCIPNMRRKLGLYPGNRFYQIFGEHLAKHTGNCDITFLELYQRYGTELCIPVTNLNKMCSEYCHPKTTPNLPIRKAVRISISLPLLYQPIKIDFGTGQGPCLYADGGILDQYPIHVFDGPELDMSNKDIFDSKEIPSSKHPKNKKTLGFYAISETALDHKIWKMTFGTSIPYKAASIPETSLAKRRFKQAIKIRNKMKQKKTYFESAEMIDPWEHATQQIEIKNIGHLMLSTLHSLLLDQRRTKIEPDDRWRTVAINTAYIGTNDYVLEPGDREFMIKQGYVCTQSFLDEYRKKSTLPNHDSAIQQTKTLSYSETNELSTDFLNDSKPNQNNSAHNNASKLYRSSDVSYVYRHSMPVYPFSNRQINIQSTETQV